MKMTPSSKFSGLIQMLEAFIEGKDQARGTIFVREMEGEFARLGLDDEEDFSDLQHAFAMYRGHDEDVRDLRSEATFAVRRLASQSAEQNAAGQPATRLESK
jgi:hypothetical protein